MTLPPPNAYSLRLIPMEIENDGLTQINKLMLKVMWEYKWNAYKIQSIHRDAEVWKRQVRKELIQQDSSTKSFISKENMYEV